MRIVIIGGGAGGLLAALMLQRDGHDVTVVERDPEPPPSDDEDAWGSWDRRGVSQLRQPHGFIGRTRETLATEVPDVWTRVGEIDTYRIDLRRFAPDQDALTESDERLQYDVMRRTTFERTVGVVADATQGLDVRRGVVVVGLMSDRSMDGVPIVTGVRTKEHGEISADLVIDSSGRRTAAPQWLAALDAPVEEWSESDGFTYHTLWFRTHDATYPPNVAGGFGGMAPGLIALLFPGDGDVFGVAMVGLGSDKALRALRDPAVFTAVGREFGPLSGWLDPDVSSPVSRVLPMGAIHNRFLRFANGSGPSVYGFVNIGDSALSTNPSLGRGIAISLMGAVELRNILRTGDAPHRVAMDFDQAKEERIMPWLWDAVDSDRNMRQVFGAALGEVETVPPSDRTLIGRAAGRDMECWRRWTAVNQALALPSSCLEDTALMERARQIGADVPPPSYDLSRVELEELLA